MRSYALRLNLITGSPVLGPRSFGCRLPQPILDLPQIKPLRLLRRGCLVCPSYVATLWSNLPRAMENFRYLGRLLPGSPVLKNPVPSRKVSSKSLPFICILHSFYLRVFNWPPQFCWLLCLCAYFNPQSAHTSESVCPQFISATPSPSQPSRRGLHFRDPVVQQRDALPQGWSSLGCYT